MNTVDAGLALLVREWLRTEDTSEIDVQIEHQLIANGMMRSDDAIISMEPAGDAIDVHTESGEFFILQGA